MVLISIVIPTLNEERHIGRLLKQFDSEELRKKHNFELIVADCHSVDATAEIAQKHHATVAFTPKGIKTNASKARIAGTLIARGEILLFLDADIIIENVDKLLRAAYTLAEGKYGGMVCKIDIHPDETIWKDRIFQSSINTSVQIVTFLGIGGGRGQCMGIRRNVYDAVGGFNPDLDVAEDYDIFSRARKHTKIRYFPNVCLYESPRRYRTKGYFRTVKGWIVNTCSVGLFQKSLSSWEKVD